MSVGPCSHGYRARGGISMGCRLSQSPEAYVGGTAQFINRSKLLGPFPGNAFQCLHDLHGMHEELCCVNALLRVPHEEGPNGRIIVFLSPRGRIDRR